MLISTGTGVVPSFSAGLNLYLRTAFRASLSSPMPNGRTTCTSCGFPCASTINPTTTTPWYLAFFACSEYCGVGACFRIGSRCFHPFCRLQRGGWHRSQCRIQAFFRRSPNSGHSTCSIGASWLVTFGRQIGSTGHGLFRSSIRPIRHRKRVLESAGGKVGGLALRAVPHHEAEFGRKTIKAQLFFRKHEGILRAALFGSLILQVRGGNKLATGGIVGLIDQVFGTQNSIALGPVSDVHETVIWPF